jgi:hypothetical protein
MSPILGIVASQNYVRTPPSSFESIATATASGVSSVTFSSIPSTYASLQIRILGRNTAAATSARSAKLRFNSDSATNYNAYHSLFGDGSTVSAESFGTVTDTNGFAVYCFTSSDTDFASAFGVAIIDIHDYASTTKNKTVRVIGGSDRNGWGRMVLNSFFWNQTSAINSITLNTDGSNWASGSTFSLYGIKGS